MDRDSILCKYKKAEEKLLVAKLLDKIQICKKSNKTVKLDFLDPVEKRILENVINQIQFKNFAFFGGFDEAQRKMLIIYPEKLVELFKNQSFDYNSVVKVIRIVLPQDLYGKYEHRNYLGSLIKLGIKREKIGDIVTYNEGADIIISEDICKFVLNNIGQLTRFTKSKIEIVNIQNIHQFKQNYKEIKIIVSSMRLDNLIAELVNTSRNNALEILIEQRVFVNYQNEIKPTKLIKQKEVISIRGNGKFRIDGIEGSTRSGKNVVKVSQYI